jgi:putative Mn2+ efflux pump MntP
MEDIMLKLILSGLALGVGLAMDASAVSMANGLNDNKMRLKKIFLIAGMFGLFQGLMPLLGYILGHTLYEALDFIEKYHIIPIIALVILFIIGSHMIVEGINEIIERKKGEDSESNPTSLTLKLLIIQAIATSIDALSVGIVISDYSVANAIVTSIIIALVTFMICIPSVYIGKRVGLKLGPYAQILGGSILVIIGFIIFFTGIF